MTDQHLYGEQTEFQFDMVETLFYRLSLNYLEYFI